MIASHIDTSPILIVGSGVFGLSTALWLARAGHTDVTLLDMQDTADAGYDPSQIDSASADVNKVIRLSYGSELAYQRLATEAEEEWCRWNAQVAALEPEADVDADGVLLPVCLRGGKGRTAPRQLWWNCGMLRMAMGAEGLSEFEERTLENMEKERMRHLQFRSDDEEDIARATAAGWAHKLDPCQRQSRLGAHKAVLDATAGFVAGDKSCAWAQHLAHKAGVKFVLGPERGKVIALETDAARPVAVTADGARHEANLIIVAGGGWTASLVPEACTQLETTAGSTATVQLSPGRPDLWGKFAPENWPVVTWGMNEGTGIYSFPRTETGAIKIGYRGTKYTNFRDVDGQRISVPKTAHVTPETEKNVPLQALSVIKEFISTMLPELQPLGIASTSLCWYSDSVDNNFLVDHVPGRPGLVVCAGGSGHGFKFLPVLGREVVKVLKGYETVFRALWCWRVDVSTTLGESEGGRVGGRNGLEEGEDGPRVLDKQKMATEADWVF